MSVHKLLKFNESDSNTNTYIESFTLNIDSNTSKRKNAVNSFEKDYFKLMNNSVYGKTMKNLRKRVRVRSVNNAKDYKK